MGITRQKDFIYISILILTIIIFIVNTIAVEKYYEKENEKYIIKEDANMNRFVRDMELLSQGISINDYQFSDSVGQEILPKLIYAYSSDECNKCIFEDITILKEKVKNYNPKDVIVLPVLKNTRNVNIALNAELEGINYKRIDKGSIRFPCRSDGSSVRFFAIWDPSGKIILPFFPDVNSPERTNIYLNFVFTKYFGGNQKIQEKCEGNN